jgi:Mg-chelatase subunit ChlD
MASPQPSETVVVLDTSRTMMTAASGGVRLDKVVEAAARVLDGLRFPQDSGAIIAVSDDAAVLKPPTVNRGALISALGAAYVNIGTESHLEKGLALAAALPLDPARRRVIVAITDGVSRVDHVRDAVVDARASGAMVQVVGFGPGITETDVAALAGRGGQWSPDAAGLLAATELVRSAIRCTP